MIIWRLCSSRYANQPLNGEGARLYGGRWSHRGIPIAYTASSLALAALELLVHIDHDVAPSNLVSIEVTVPPSVLIERVKISSLPKNWRAYPAPEHLREIGSAWAMGKRSLLLEVPSVVVPQERNYLVNPQHPEFTKLKIGRLKPFEFDPRLFNRT
ncbi:MAG TPA: RES domain-containing protein [Thermodesulfobacteriota bacterium]|nr:RES domain-containing protein [Thermodesulfobacteriota bacterium]